MAGPGWLAFGEGAGVSPLSILPYFILSIPPPSLPSLNQLFSKHIQGLVCAQLRVRPLDGVMEPDAGPGPHKLAFQEGRHACW